jgi:hypothetical protein
MPTRRQTILALTALAGGTAAHSVGSWHRAGSRYDEAVRNTWRHTVEHPGKELNRELVRYATLAASSHNTQCWKFAIANRQISILPDWSRRCPAVDPDDHHLFVSLGCATENLLQAAQAFGQEGAVQFDTDSLRDGKAERVQVHLTPSPAVRSPLFEAIPKRQCTRAEYDGRKLSNEDLKSLNENDKYAKQIRSSAGIAVFGSDRNDREHWVETGRCYERFALQATALGIKNAFLNQPVEVATLRPQLANYLGIGDCRPDLVVRFGYGNETPRSLRRPIEGVIIV